MNKQNTKTTRPGQNNQNAPAENEKQNKKAFKRLSEYGKQLEEKQKVKEMYGMREKQFRRFFGMAMRSQGTPGANLLILLERRLDNVIYRLKLATTRAQARQMIVHGHILVNGSKVSSPSYLVSLQDTVSLAQRALTKSVFLENVVDKRLNINIKVPEWLESVKNNRSGKVLRYPARADIQYSVEEHLIVELYSK